ncbi:MAG TPA: hypothetical protein VJ905_11565 [Halalkalibaculum sp.]|nr:hypothetical protein [Halalkalibaculum sp.]
MKLRILIDVMHGSSNYIILLFALFLCYGCSSTKVYHTGEERYKPTRSVEILTHTPQRAYIVIATLEATSPAYANGEFVFEKMRNRAQRIGAHAIIPMEYHTVPGHSTVPLKPSYTPPGRPGKANVPRSIIRIRKQPKSWAKALAIRYTESEKENENRKENKEEEKETARN